MTRMKPWLATAAAVAIAGSVWGQEPVPPDEEQTATAPATRIKVLENPYDIASFYRSRQGQGSGFFGSEEPGWYGTNRYPIAGYYRQHPGTGYSRFWTSGYGYGRARGTAIVAVGYTRTIGQNGDLFLFAPTILAPVGPLTGVFYEGR